MEGSEMKTAKRLAYAVAVIAVGFCLLGAKHCEKPSAPGGGVRPLQWGEGAWTAGYPIWAELFEPHDGNLFGVGEHIDCDAISVDFDHWTPDPGGEPWEDDYDAEGETFEWSATDGQENPAGEWKDPPGNDVDRPTWIAPWTPGEYTLEVLCDDDVAQAPWGAPQWDDPAVDNLEVTITLVEVVEIAWATYGDNTELDTNPNAGGGKRIFPGKKTPDDQDASDRRKVRVRASLSEVVEGFEVYFRIFDVDDPSSSTAPIDTNDGAPPKGGDNRGTGGSGGMDMAHTDENGIAELVMTVTMRPGDNYKVIASCSEDYIENLTLEDFEEGPAHGESTEMLTVWRRLGVEFDHMGEPPAAQKFGIVSGTSQKITSTVLHSQGTPGWAVNCLQGGVLDPEGVTPGNAVDFVNDNTWEVCGNETGYAQVSIDYRTDKFDNDDENGADDDGEVWNMATYAADPSNDSFGINTDDPKWLQDLDPPQANVIINAMNGYFDDAYIKCYELTEGNEHDTFAFVRMTETAFPTVDVAGDSAFWTVCVGWAYESADTKIVRCRHGDHTFYLGDDDPENEGVPAGYRSSVHGIVESISGEKCLLFCEIIRDRGALSIGRVTTHEVGHLLGLEHATYVNDFKPASKDGIMGWQYHETPACWKWWLDKVWGHESPDRFSYQNIADLRANATD